MQAAARNLGLQLHILHASSDPEINMAFATLVEVRAGALVIGTDGFLVSRSELLAALALRHIMPAIYQFRTFASAGGLMSYGSSVTDGYRQIGAYTGLVPRQLYGYGRIDWSTKLIRGLTSEAAAGFRSRRGPNHDSTFVTPHNAPFATYKAARVHHAARRRGGLAARGAGAGDGKAADHRVFGLRHICGPRSLGHCFLAEAARTWLDRGPQPYCRVPLGRGQQRPRR